MEWLVPRLAKGRMMMSLVLLFSSYRNFYARFTISPGTDIFCFAFVFTLSAFVFVKICRKIHTSCREHCCRKKKFNRSIDPAALENVVAPALGPVRRYNTVATPAAVHRSPMGSLSLSARKGMQPSEAASFRLRTTGSPSPASVRDHRDRPAAAAAAPSSCNSDGIDVRLTLSAREVVM